MAMKIGLSYEAKEISYWSHKARHMVTAAAAMATQGALTKQDPIRLALAGALGAGIAEVVGEELLSVDTSQLRTLTEEQIRVKAGIAQVVAGGAALAAGFDEAGVNAAIFTAGVAVNNNLVPTVLKKQAAEDAIKPSVEDSEAPEQERGRSLERTTPHKKRSLTPPHLNDTYYADGTHIFQNGVQSCYQARGQEKTLPNLALIACSYGLDALFYANEGLDQATFGLWSKVGDGLDAMADGARTITRRTVRFTTGDQRLGQNAGDYVYLGLSVIGPKKMLAPAQMVQKVAKGTQLSKTATVHKVSDIVESKATFLQKSPLNNNVTIARNSVMTNSYTKQGFYNSHVIRQLLEARYPGQVTSSTLPLGTQKTRNLLGYAIRQTGQRRKLYLIIRNSQSLIILLNLIQESPEKLQKLRIQVFI
jgi:hypothetical protein